MRPEILRTLQDADVAISTDGTIRMYHATSKAAATAIRTNLVLRGEEPEDLAQRMLRRDGGGSAFLSSSPSIVEDLHSAEVVLAVSLRPQDAPGAEVSRPAWGDPPRIEVEIRLPAGGALPLTFADCLTRTVARNDLSREVQTAIEAFEASDVGRQLADRAEQRGRCQRASMSFIAALRESGADGQLIEWTWGNDWHTAVLVGDDVIDWTASQFGDGEEQAGAMPQPLVETRARIDVQLHETYGAAAGISLPADDSFFGRRAPSWEQAQSPITGAESQEERPATK